MIADDQFDAPGEPPVGSVVTDARSRVCWRDTDGWQRADLHVPLTWEQVVQAVGGPERTPLPGQPTIVSTPAPRAQVPTVVRPGGTLDTVVQTPILGPDGEPLLDARGAPQLRTTTETVEISEVVPE